MTTHVALLRGINVGGQKKVPMAQLRAILKKLQLGNLQTYIQSGNLVFNSKEENPSILEDKIQKAILKDFRFEVSVLVLSKKNFRRIFEANPFTDQNNIENKSLYFSLLKGPPSDAAVKELQKLSFENEEYFIAQDCVYLCCKIGYGKAKLNNNLLERKLEVSATTRNYNTMIRLLEMAEDN